MFLLLDECCGKALGRKATELGHTVQRSVDVAVLGRGASDPEVFAFAARSGAVLVTVNRGDFLALASRESQHAGILVIPSLPSRSLLPLFENLLSTAERLIASTPGLIVELEANGTISSLTSR